MSAILIEMRTSHFLRQSSHDQSTDRLSCEAGTGFMEMLKFLSVGELIFTSTNPVYHCLIFIRSFCIIYFSLFMTFEAVNYPVHEAGYNVWEYRKYYRYSTWSPKSFFEEPHSYESTDKHYNRDYDSKSFIPGLLIETHTFSFYEVIYEHWYFSNPHRIPQ